MTTITYTATHISMRTKSQPKSAVLLLPHMSVQTGILLMICLALVAGYIIQSNMIAAHTYGMKLMYGQLFSLEEENGLYAAQLQTSTDAEVLAAYARAHNMVRTKDVTYLFTENTVAMRTGVSK